MPVNGYHDLIHGHSQLFCRRADDTEIGLVRNQPVKFGFFHAIMFKRVIHDTSQGPYRNLEHLVAFHLDAYAAAFLGLDTTADTDIGNSDANIQQLASNLYGDHVFAFQLTSVLLVVAVAGTVLLTRKWPREVAETESSDA